MLLPDIRYRLKKVDSFVLPILVYNENMISRYIDIIRELVDRLELMDDVVRNKIILIKEDLMIV